jgi:hypothetical protein
MPAEGAGKPALKCWMLGIHPTGQQTSDPERLLADHARMGGRLSSISGWMLAEPSLRLPVVQRLLRVVRRWRSVVTAAQPPSPKVGHWRSAIRLPLGWTLAKDGRSKWATPRPDGRRVSVQANGPRQAQTGRTLLECQQTGLVRPRLSAGCSGIPDGPVNV